MFRPFQRASLIVPVLSLCGLALLCAFDFRQVQALDAAREFTQYGHQVWQTDQGLPQNSVHTILQSRDGYLWIGTSGGLARFDGIRFTVFDKQNTAQITNNQIRRLFEDQHGNLWISTADGLARFKDGKFTSFTTRDGLSSNSVWSVYEDHTGSLWIATVSGLNRYRKGKFTAYTTREGLSHDNIEAILEDKTGTLWIGTADGLTRFKDGKFTIFSEKDGLAGNVVKTLYQGKDGRVWIGTNNGLTSFQHGRFVTYTVRDGLSHHSIEAITEDRSGRLWVGTQNGLNQLQSTKFISFTTAQGLPNNRINLIHEDRVGNLWIGTASGLARFQENGFVSHSNQDSLSNNPILSLYEDREGSLWIGTEANGLNILKSKKFTTFTTRDGLSANVVRAIYEDQSSNLWIGTQDGGLSRLKDGQWVRYTNKEGLASNDVLAVCDDRQGNLWIGTAEGLNRLRQGVVTKYGVRDGLTDNYVRSLYVDRLGSLWIGTRRGLVQYKNGRFTTYTMLDGLASDLVGAITEGRDGSLWIGTLGGLSRFKDGEFTNYTVKEGLSSDVVIALYEDADGMLWIGTRGGGLSRFKDGKFASYTIKDGLSDDVIYHILEDAQGDLWMSSNKGIIRVSKKELESYLPTGKKAMNVVTYGTADGMETQECSGGGHPAGWKTRDGKLWFATIKGVAMIDPAHININQQPPPVVIEQVIVDGENFIPDTQIQLSPGKSRFEFYYAGLSFIAPQRVAYKYKLEGFDQDWIDAGTRRVAYYTNIPSGNYRFRVIAANNDGVWNEVGTQFDFYLKPHFYRTWWFYSLCLVGLALVGIGWYRARVRRIEKQFSAVLAERNRIAREIHDTLAQGFAGISVQLELVARMLATSPERAKTHLDQARSLVRDSLSEARRSVWDLRSQALEGSDLPSALSETARRLTADTNVQAQVQVNGTYRELSRTLEDNLLRIGQEAMTNAIKHAQAQHLYINLKFEPKHLRLSVRDDGRGFDEATRLGSRNGHFGLLGMKERAEQIGGHLSVNSRPNEGTEIVIDVPLN